MSAWVRCGLTIGMAMAFALAGRPALCQGSQPGTTNGADEKSDDLDRRLLRIVQHTPQTDDVYRAVLHGLNFLPPDVKRSFVNAGISVVITPTLAQIGSQGKGSEYSPVKHCVLICERQRDGSISDLKRLHITTLHELGHAYDQLLGYPSRGEKFHTIYGREAANVPSEYQPRLSYFLQPGQPGPRECFASLFACVYYRGDDKRLTELKSSFPQSLQYVQSLHL